MANFASKILGFANQIFSGTVTDVPCTSLATAKFAEVMTQNLYLKIITEAMDRAILPEAVKKDAFNLSVYDSYSPFKRGLSYLIVDAMIHKSDVKYRISESDGTVKGVKLFEKIANPNQEDNNGADILELNFSKYEQASIVALLFALIHNLMKSVDKGVTVSQALLVKIHKLSEMIDNPSNNAPLTAQLKQLNEAISAGKAGYMDALSSIEFATYDPAPVDKTIQFLFGIISTITGFPLSYLFGEVVTGLGDSSGGDDTRLNSAIKFYYYQIVNNILLHVWNESFEYKVIVSDVNSLISMFAFIETTTLLTDEGKIKFMRNNTGFTDEDIALGDNAPTATPPTTTNVNVNE